MRPKNPRIAASVKAKVGYNQLAERYDSIVQNFHNQHIEIPAVKKIIKNIDGKKVLDVGCATGTHTKILVKKGAKVSGVDVSKEMIKIAQKNVPQADFFRADMKKLPFKDSSFDLLFYGLCLHYEKNLKPVFKEASRVLKKGGRIVFSTHHPAGTGHTSIRCKGERKVVFDDYFNHKIHTMNFDGVELKIYPKTISEMFNPLIEVGFSITKIYEPQPVQTAPRDSKWFDYTMRIHHLSLLMQKRRESLLEPF